MGIIMGVKEYVEGQIVSICIITYVIIHALIYENTVHNSLTILYELVISIFCKIICQYRG